MTYRVKNWATLYENNRTRELVKMNWVPVPNSHDGDGYTTLVCRSDGPELLGAWLVILQVASKCEPRGTLVRDSGEPHDSASISRMTRIPEKLVTKALSVLVSECKWLEIIDTHEGAGIPQEGASKSHPSDYGMEGNGRNGMEGKEPVGGYHKDTRTVLYLLNETAGRHYRETATNLGFISARLQEPEVTLEGIRLMLQRMVQKWGKDPKMTEYLQPSTLFNATKFQGYYDNRELPVADAAHGTAGRSGNSGLSQRQDLLNASLAQYETAVPETRQPF